MSYTIEQAIAHTQRWHDIRHSGIGGSDSYVACGYRGYGNKNMIDLWLEKRGDAPQTETAPSLKMRLALLAEEELSREFTNITRIRTALPEGTYRSCEYPFMLANMDRIGTDAEGKKVVVELKDLTNKPPKADMLWRDENDEELIPFMYECQVLHYLIVSGFDYGYLCAYTRWNDRIEIRKIERGKDIEQWIIDKETEFWRKVRDNVMPDIDDSISCTKALNELYPIKSGKSTELNLPGTMNDLAKAMIDRKKLDKMIRYLQNSLRILMGDANTALIKDGDSIYRAKLVEVKVKPHEVAGSEYVRMDIKKVIGDKTYPIEYNPDKPNMIDEEPII